MTFKTISVIGLGYIGLPTAAVFASRKIKVIGVDIDQKTVDTINRGQIHIVEPDLDIVVHAAVTEGYLRATTMAEAADAFLIAVPTPFKSGITSDHEPDLSYIESASQSIAPVLKKGDIVILESTSPVGATEQMAAWLAQARPDLTFPQTHGEESDIRVAHCPERVLPGQVLRELVQNDRVIGGMTPACSNVAIALYKVFVQGECVITNARTAEMCKLTENSFRDVNIALVNELSMICDELGISVWELIRLANRHPRVNLLQPGPGVGGHCIAIDPWFIVSQSPESSKLIRAARGVNDEKPEWVLRKINKAISKVRDEKRKATEDIVVACFGLSFKPNIDDLRESPSVEIVKKLSSVHAGRVLAIEPHVKDLPSSIGGQVELVEMDYALGVADIAVLLVDHREFGKNAPKDVEIVDTRGIWVA